MSIALARAALRAPFPWFGGKSRVAHLVWERFGDVRNYVEPFFGSGAVLLARPGRPGIETVNDADAYLCLGPDTKVLRGDLTWALASQVQEGDQLIAFDEFNGGAREGLRAPTRYRHWRTGTVTAVRRVVKPCYRLTFDDGTSVVASDDHLWLGGSHRSSGRGWRWQATKGLVCNRASQRSWILKLAPVTERLNTWEAGWIAGFFDGEGSVSSNAGWRLVATQNPGATLDRAEALVQSAICYTHDGDGVWWRAYRWAIEHGDDPQLRIALCGYEHPEASFPAGWTEVPWKASGGYGRSNRGKANARRERIWFSPHCLRAEQASLFHPIESPTPVEAGRRSS